MPTRPVPRSTSRPQPQPLGAARSARRGRSPARSRTGRRSGTPPPRARRPARAAARAARSSCRRMIAVSTPAAAVGGRDGHPGDRRRRARRAPGTVSVAAVDARGGGHPVAVEQARASGPARRPAAGVSRYGPVGVLAEDAGHGPDERPATPRRSRGGAGRRDRRSRHGVYRAGPTRRQRVLSVARPGCRSWTDSGRSAGGQRLDDLLERPSTPSSPARA